MAKESQLLAQVKEILFLEWDPIGVNDNEWCRDEYDHYAATIVRMIQSNANEQKVVNHLQSLQLNSMGLSNTNAERDQQIARRLLALRG
jgi:hypothetical protein